MVTPREIGPFDATLHSNEFVDVYRNLKFREEHVWSVRSPTTGLVMGHSFDQLVMKDAVMIVSEAGVRRARESGQKNVHAVVRGRVATPEECHHIRLQEDLRRFGSADSRGVMVTSAVTGGGAVSV